MAVYVPSNRPATRVASIMARLNVDDWIDVATSFAFSTCLLTAVCNKVTRGPNEIPHKNKAVCDIPEIVPNSIKISIEMSNNANIDMVSSLRCLSVYFIASNAEV